MPVRAIKAVEGRSIGAIKPELYLVLKDDAAKGLPPGWSALMDHLCDYGIWHQINSSTSGPLIYASDGDFHTFRMIRPDPKGRDSVRGNDGSEWKYSWFDWPWGVTYMESLGEMVKCRCYFKGTGNIQTGWFAKSLVEAKIKEAGLEFTVRRSDVVYTGPMDRFREVDVFPHYNGITWGVKFKWGPYKGARRNEEWGGACWPDQATVRAVADAFIKDGTKSECSNLVTLRDRFPEHPAIANLEKYEQQKGQ